MIKEEMKKLWESLSGVGAGIYERYGQIKAASDRQHENRLAQAKKEYRDEQNAAAAQARISDRNAQTLLSSHGLGASGESLQAKLMNNLVKNDAMQAAADRYGRAVLELETAKDASDAQRDKEMLSEMTGLSKELYALKLEEARGEQDALAKDRELSLKEQKQTSDRELEEKKLALEREKLEEESRQFDKDFDEETKKQMEEYQESIRELEESVSRYEGLMNREEERGTVPEISPLDMYEHILAESRTGLEWWSDSEEEYEQKFRTRVAEKIRQVVENSAIDEDYRIVLETFGRMGGYL